MVFQAILSWTGGAFLTRMLAVYFLSDNLIYCFCSHLFQEASAGWWVTRQCATVHLFLSCIFRTNSLRIRVGNGLRRRNFPCALLLWGLLIVTQIMSAANLCSENTPVMGCGKQRIPLIFFGGGGGSAVGSAFMLSLALRRHNQSWLSTFTRSAVLWAFWPTWKSVLFQILVVRAVRWCPVHICLANTHFANVIHTNLTDIWVLSVRFPALKGLWSEVFRFLSWFLSMLHWKGNRITKNLCCLLISLF